MRPSSSTMMRSAISRVCSLCVMRKTVRPGLNSFSAVDFQVALVVVLVGELVENEDAGISQDGASQGETLLLAAGEFVAALADGRLVFLGAARDEIVRVGPPGRRLHFLLGGTARAVGDVVVNGVVEEEGFLRHQANLLPEAAQVDIAQIEPVDEDASRDRGPRSAASAQRESSCRNHWARRGRRSRRLESKG